MQAYELKVTADLILHKCYLLKNSIYLCVALWRVTMCPNEHSNCVTTCPHAVTTYLHRGQIVAFRCGHISLHNIATIDDIYLNDILFYTGNSIP